jgi:uncharacterized membrane protein YdbT with pleckstrin-like domain
MRQDITDLNLSRQIILKRILSGQVLTYRRSFLDYIQWWALLFLVSMGILAIYIFMPNTAIRGSYELFVPLSILALIIHKKYNRKYVISERGIAFKIGLLSLSSSEQALSYSKMRAVRIKRRLIQRILDLGDIGIETILGDQPEVNLRGINRPTELTAAIDFLIAREAKRSELASAGKPQEQRHTALYSSAEAKPDSAKTNEIPRID